ncbi:MAG: biotin--[acetyl-CoA-carboxylase] ligase, partial [Candidatus Acidiferrales bacterium]
YSRLDILAHLLAAFDRYYNRLLKEGAAPIVTRFLEVSPLARGQRVRVATPWEQFNGVTEGLDETGTLRVRRDDGQTVSVLAGDVTEA